MNVTVTDRDSERAEKVTARVLLAAYGVHSSVRQQLHPDTSFHWEGTRMFRGTAVREPFLDGATMTLIYGEEEKRFLAYPISRDVENEGEELINWVAMVPEADSGRSRATTRRTSRPTRRTSSRRSGAGDSTGSTSKVSSPSRPTCCATR